MKYKLQYRVSIRYQEEKNLSFSEFAISADLRVKVKENEKIDKFLNLAKKLKNLWNMMVTLILIVVGVLGMISKYLEKEWGNWKSEEESRPSRPHHS